MYYRCSVHLCCFVLCVQPGPGQWLERFKQALNFASSKAELPAGPFARNQHTHDDRLALDRTSAALPQSRLCTDRHLSSFLASHRVAGACTTLPGIYSCCANRRMAVPVLMLAVSALVLLQSTLGALCSCVPPDSAACLCWRAAHWYMAQARRTLRQRQRLRRPPPALQTQRSCTLSRQQTRR